MHWQANGRTRTARDVRLLLAAAQTFYNRSASLSLATIAVNWYQVLAIGPSLLPAEIVLYINILLFPLPSDNNVQHDLQHWSLTTFRKEENHIHVMIYPVPSGMRGHVDGKKVYDFSLERRLHFLSCFTDYYDRRVSYLLRPFRPRYVRVSFIGCKVVFPFRFLKQLLY